MTNIIPQEPLESWQVRIAQADAACVQEAYWVAKAHAEGLVPEPEPVPTDETVFSRIADELRRICKDEEPDMDSAAVFELPDGYEAELGFRDDDDGDQQYIVLRNPDKQPIGIDFDRVFKPGFAAHVEDMLGRLRILPR